MKTKRFEYKREVECKCCGRLGYIREVEGKDFCGWCGSFQPVPETKEDEKPVTKPKPKRAPAKKKVAPKPATE